MKILLDHCIDWRLARSLPGHYVRSAREMGWDELENGDLLGAAAAQFDVVLTVDRHVSSQQNLATLPIAVIVLVAHTSRLEHLAPLAPQIEDALVGLTLRTVIEVSWGKL